MPNSPTVETARNDLTVETARWIMRPQPTNIGLYFIYDKITNQVIADGLRRVVAEQQLALLEKLAAESAKPTLAAVELFPLLRAAPHRWGNGLVHRFDDEKKQTWCGKTLDRCPGTKTLGKHEQITCRLCLRSIKTRAQAEERHVLQWVVILRFLRSCSS